MGFLREVVKKPQVKKLPLRFKFFLFRYFFGTSNPDYIQEKGGKKYLSIYLPPYPSKAFDNFLDAQVKASRGEPVPEIADIAVNSRCDYDCWHCLVEGEKGSLNSDMIIETIKKLERMGTYQFLLTGGDPLKREDLADIISASSDESVVLVSTPGGLDEKRAQEMKRAGCQGILVGLEHREENKNDRRMGLDGAYRRSLISIRNARKADILPGVWTVVTGDRIDGIRDFVKFVKRKGATDLAIFEPLARGGVKEEHLLNEGERRLLSDLQLESKKKKGYPRVISGPFMDGERFMGCTAGYNRLYVNPDGNVYPCEMLEESWGNIKEERIDKIWGKMNGRYDEPVCGCGALGPVKKRLPRYYRGLIR